MPEDFVIARNPDGDSKLPFLPRIPLVDRPVILKARDTWPRAAKIYFVGPVSYVTHEGDRPIALRWKLQHALPSDFFNTVAVATQ